MESKEVLVKDISELKPGIRIKLINCNYCGDTHKYITGNTEKQLLIDKSKEIFNELAVNVYPTSGCTDNFFTAEDDINLFGDAINQLKIDSGNVFRYIDLDDQYERREEFNLRVLETIGRGKVLINTKK